VTTLPELATSYIALQASLTGAVLDAVNEIWNGVDPGNAQKSWVGKRVGDRLFTTVSVGQSSLAQHAGDYISAAVKAQGVDPDPAGVPNPVSFGGVASDGRGLGSLLLSPLIELEEKLNRGWEPEKAHTSAGASLNTIVRTQVVDAGRSATATAMAAEKKVKFWVRVLTPPSCGRCAILAGKTYEWQNAFFRHPACDCVVMGGVEALAVAGLRTDPRRYFESLSEQDQNKYFGKGRAEAIRLGANMNRVVNARAAKSGLSAPGLSRSGRLMPAAIIEAGGGDREATVKLLRKNGYLR
jgi:hypothetical protein